MACVAGAVVFVSVEHPLVEIHEIALQVRGLATTSAEFHSIQTLQVGMSLKHSLAACMFSVDCNKA